MYDHIEGDLTHKSPTQAVISAGGVGYRLIIPISTFEALPARGRCRLYAYLQVREDALKLFGFATEEERRIFEHLITVSGVGPNTAIGVLNGISVQEFRKVVAGGEVAALIKVKGIGRKTAERIVLELKKDMERELSEMPAAGPTGGAGVTSDALAAMMALGYTRGAAEAAVTRAMDKLGPGAPLEQVVREALQQV